MNSMYMYVLYELSPQIFQCCPKKKNIKDLGTQWSCHLTMPCVYFFLPDVWQFKPGMTQC